MKARPITFYNVKNSKPLEATSLNYNIKISSTSFCLDSQFPVSWKHQFHQLYLNLEQETNISPKPVDLCYGIDVAYGLPKPVVISKNAASVAQSTGCQNKIIIITLIIISISSTRLEYYSDP